MENNWIVISINNVVSRDNTFDLTYFTARKESTGDEKEFYSVYPPEVGDTFYPTNID
jgi:hypothetical protein